MVMNSINKRGLCDFADRKDAPCTPTAINNKGFLTSAKSAKKTSRHDGGRLVELPHNISRKLCLWFPNIFCYAKNLGSRCLLVFYLRFNTASILLIDEDKPVLTCGLIGRDTNMGGFATCASAGLSVGHQPCDDAPHTPHRGVSHKERCVLITCFILGFALGILSGCWEYQPA